MTTTVAPTNNLSKLAQKLAKAKEIYANILQDEANLFQTRDQMLVRAWQLGELLTELKEEVGHGKWLFWLGGNWPQLGERNAQRCMQFYKANDQIRGIPRISTKFEIDSVRKFMWGYIPEKERPQLAHDVTDNPSADHLTFVNHFFKWDRQITAGHAEMPPLDLFRREMERPLRRIIELAGRDWILEILG